MTGPGFPTAALDFYEDLEGDNTKAFWTSHRETYESSVRAPMAALLAALEPEFGPAKLFRPHRDVRFSADKSPYKTHQGGYVQASAGVGYYVQVSAAGLLVSGGWWRAQGQQVVRWRDVVAGPAGAHVEQLIAAVESAGFHLAGEQLKRAPRGVDPAAPRIGLLRHKSLYANRDHGAPPWLATDEVVDRVAGDWRTLTPLVQALADAVGPGDDDARR